MNETKGMDMTTLPMTRDHVTSIDFNAMWRAQLDSRTDIRLDAEADRAFWDEFAPRYDERTAPPGSYDHTLRAILNLTRPGDTLLDVGAGTGRFALPIAQQGRWVTALDHAPAMLDLLRDKATAADLTSITIIESPWDDAEVVPHDVVLAAWALYRQPDLEHAVAKLAAAARRTLIIVVGDTDDPPHRPLVKALWGSDGEPDFPVHLLMLGVMRQIGLRADLRMIYETRSFQFPDTMAAAKHFAPLHAADSDTARLACEMDAIVTSDAAGIRYAYSFPVAIMTWHRPG